MTIKTEPAVIFDRSGLHPLAHPCRDFVWTNVVDGDDGLQIVEIWRRNEKIATAEVWEIPAQ